MNPFRRTRRAIRSPTGPAGPGRLVALLVLAAPLLGCGEPEPTGSDAGLTREEFVEAVVALRDAELDVQARLEQDSADVLFEARKDSILAAYETTESELHAFLARHPDLEYQDALWDTITQRLKRPVHDPTAPGAFPEEAPPVPESARPERSIRPGPDGR